MDAAADQIRYGEVDRDFIAHFDGIDPAEDGPVLMLNLMAYRDVADYPPDHPDANAGLTGMQADDRYAPLDILADVGAALVVFGNVVDQPVGDEGWQRVGIVSYRSVGSFLRMQEREDFVALHVHKDAGMRRTVIAMLRPTSGTLADGDPARLRIDLVGSEPAPGGPGRLVLEVVAVPVGDGRRGWTHAVISDGDLDRPAEPGDPATAVVIDALLRDLP